MVRRGSAWASREGGRPFTLLYGLGGKGAFWLVIVALMLPSLFFFFWMISLSFKSQVENTAYPPVFVPSSLGLESYAEVFRKHPFPQYARNSTIAGFGATGIALLIGVPAAYGIVKWRRYEMALLILLARLVPPMSFLIPWFAATRSLGLSNSYIALILGHMVAGLPLVVWIMIGFFEDLNPELEDASSVDGCGPYGSFFRIALPLTLPGLVVSAIMAFITSWNDFMFSVVLSGPKTRTLPVAVYNMLSFETVNWGPLAAATIMVTLPAVLLTLFIQRYIVSGLTAGAIKG